MIKQKQPQGSRHCSGDLNNVKHETMGGREKISIRQKTIWGTCFLAILLPVLLLTLKTTAHKIGYNLSTELNPTQNIPANPKTIDTIPVIKGSVKDEKGDPVGFASVVIKGTGQGTMVDKEGNFSLKLPPGSKFISVSCIGYQMQIIPLNDPSEFIQVVLRPLVIDTTLGVIIVTKKSKKKKNVTVAEEKPNTIKIYPNPLPPYATLNIEWQYPVEDDHSVEIFDLRGVSVQKKFINVTRKTSKALMQLSLNNPGDYLLCIMNMKTHKIFKTQLMVN